VCYCLHCVDITCSYLCLCVFIDLLDKMRHPVHRRILQMWMWWMWMWTLHISMRITCLQYVYCAVIFVLIRSVLHLVDVQYCSTLWITLTIFKNFICLLYINCESIRQCKSLFFITTAATAVACLSHRNSVCPFVHLSVYDMGGSVKNGASQDHQIFTVGCLEDSSFRNCKSFP